MSEQCYHQINVPTNPVPAEFARKLERERDKWKNECRLQWGQLSQACHNAIGIQNIRWGYDGDCGALKLASCIEDDCNKGMKYGTETSQ